MKNQKSVSLYIGPSHDVPKSRALESLARMHGCKESELFLSLFDKYLMELGLMDEKVESKIKTNVRYMRGDGND